MIESNYGDMPPGWIEIYDYGELHILQNELEFELGIGHALHQLPLRVVAKCDASDDILVQITDGSQRVAAVHLTYTKNPPEKPPFPTYSIFPNFDHWAAEEQKTSNLLNHPR